MREPTEEQVRFLMAVVFMALAASLSVLFALGAPPGFPAGELFGVLGWSAGAVGGVLILLFVEAVEVDEFEEVHDDA